VTWSSRFQSDHRQAHSDRAGRVLLAGVAAHTHIPSGGQGLQVGIQDAMNLGWKLAAVVAGRAPHELLGTYEDERRPVARTTIRNTDLAFRYETSRSTILRFVRWAFMRLMALPSIQIGVIRQFAGVTLRYRFKSGGASLVGRRVPDARLRLTGGGSTRIYEIMRRGRFVLLDRTPERTFAKRARTRYSQRIDIVEVAAVERADLPSAVLIRPDGFVVWTSQDRRNHTMEAELERWCGSPEEGLLQSMAAHAAPEADQNGRSRERIRSVAGFSSYEERAATRPSQRAGVHDPK
jgi:hypothetical protein